MYFQRAGVYSTPTYYKDIFYGAPNISEIMVLLYTKGSFAILLKVLEHDTQVSIFAKKGMHEHVTYLSIV